MATSITNYTTLQTYIARLLAREGDSDVTDYIPDFIHLCESDLNLNLRAREMITTVNINPSNSNKYVDLPTGYLETISFNDNYGDPLEEVSMAELEELRYASGNGAIEYYAITDRIEFERTGNASLNYPMTYYKKLDIAADNTNDILTSQPNLYVYGACMHAAPYIQDDQRIAVWNSGYRSILKALNFRDNRSRRKSRTDLSGTPRFNILKGY